MLGAEEVSLGPIPNWDEMDRQKYEEWVKQIGPYATFPSLLRTTPNVEGARGELVQNFQTMYAPPPTQAPSVVKPGPTPNMWQWPTWSLPGNVSKAPAGFPWWLLLLAAGAAYWYYSKQQRSAANPDDMSAKTWRERLTTMGLMFGFGLLKGTGEVAAKAAEPVTQAQVKKLLEKYRGAGSV